MAEYQIGDVVRVQNGGWYGYTGPILRIIRSPTGTCFYHVFVREKDGSFHEVSYCPNAISLVKKGNTTMAEIKDSEDRTDGKKEKPLYRQRIEELLDKQQEKGIKKYGVTLDRNDTLTSQQRVEHLEEELIDGLMYCEHWKESFCKDDISADNYQRAALRTAQADKLSLDDVLLNGVMGLCGEAGECIDLVKKNRFQGHRLDFEKLKKELGDVAWYLAVSSYAAGYKFSEVLLENIKKLEERYPEGFSKERSIGRKEYSEKQSDVIDQSLFDG